MPEQSLPHCRLCGYATANRLKVCAWCLKGTERNSLEDAKLVNAMLRPERKGGRGLVSRRKVQE